LVVKDSPGLKVVWTEIVPVFMPSDSVASPKSFEVMMTELGKRMKARFRNAKKARPMALLRQLAIDSVGCGDD